MIGTKTTQRVATNAKEEIKMNKFFSAETSDSEVILETKKKMDEILTGKFVEQEYLNEYIGDLNTNELLKLQSEIKSLLNTTELEIANRLKDGK